MKCFYSDDLEENCVFVAIYADGSGADLFKKNGQKIISAEGMLIPDEHWFTDSGYLWFIYLSDNFRLFCEKVGDSAGILRQS